ncbi:hypothetical protein BLOT_002804 [Blomia tropicalis]|nr:hypothetical protein BLOT_002804 [Blomia tropicalis]
MERLFFLTFVSATLLVSVFTDNRTSDMSGKNLKSEVFNNETSFAYYTKNQLEGAEINYWSQWTRVDNDSMDFEIRNNPIVKQLKDLEHRLQNVCYNKQIDGCVSYLARIDSDLRKFVDSLGESIHFFDGYFQQVKNH